MITLNNLSRSKLLKSWPVLDGNGGGFHLRSLEGKILPFPSLGIRGSGNLDNFVHMI